MPRPPDHHTCRHPFRHRLLIGAVVLAWLVFVPRLGGMAVWKLSGDPVLGLLSIGLSLLVGTAFVKALVDWRCQPPQKTRRGLSPLAHLTIAALLLRRGSR
jgi:hypothetical protein